MTTRILLALALCGSFSTACDSKTDDKKAETKKSDDKKSDDKKSDDKKVDAKKTDAKSEAKVEAKVEAKTGEVAPAEPAAAAGTPAATNPKDLFAEFTKPDGDVMALMTKYENGATFTGKLVNVAAEANGDPVLFMDVDGKSKISLGFTDKAAIKAKNLKVGDELTVTCKIGGAMDNLMQVIDCTAK